MPFDDFKSPSKVIISSMGEEYLQKGYCLTLDNYYTSPELAKALLMLETDSFGTLHKKEGLPSDFWNWNPVKGDPPMVKFNDKIAVMRWNDVTKTKKEKIVSMLSTMYIGKLEKTSKKDRNTITQSEYFKT